MIKYTDDHEWIRQESDGEVTVGITDYAQEQLGDIVFVELPEVGRDVSKGDEIAVVESVKAASDIYAPISGNIIAVNEALNDAPETVNESPMENGWFFRIKPSEAGELDSLLDEAAYQALIEE